MTPYYCYNVVAVKQNNCNNVVVLMTELLNNIAASLRQNYCSNVTVRETSCCDETRLLPQCCCGDNYCNNAAVMTELFKQYCCDETELLNNIVASLRQNYFNIVAVMTQNY